MGIMNQVGACLHGRSISQSIKIALPERDVRIWQLEDQQVVVIESKPNGTFVGFHIDKRPYARVKGIYKRMATLSKKRGANANASL